MLLIKIDVEKVNKSYVWLWVLLGVVGGAFCIGVGIGFYIIKKKKKVDTLIWNIYNNL